MPAKQVSPESFHLFYTFPYWSPVIIFSLIPAPFLVIFLKIVKTIELSRSVFKPRGIKTYYLRPNGQKWASDKAG